MLWTSAEEMVPKMQGKNWMKYKKKKKERLFFKKSTSRSQETELCVIKNTKTISKIIKNLYNASQ